MVPAGIRMGNCAEQLIFKGKRKSRRSLSDDFPPNYARSALAGYGTEPRGHRVRTSRRIQGLSRVATGCASHRPPLVGTLVLAEFALGLDIARDRPYYLFIRHTRRDVAPGAGRSCHERRLDLDSYRVVRN